MAQFPREELQPPRNMRNLFLAAVALVFRIDQLQIVDHQESDIVPLAEPSRIGGDAEHALGGGIVDEQPRLPQHVSRLDQLVHVVGSEMALAQLMAVHPGLSAQQALRQFHARLFEADEKHGGCLELAHWVADNHISDNVQAESGFADRRPGGEDHEFGVMQSGRQLVEIEIANG